MVRKFFLMILIAGGLLTGCSEDSLDTYAGNDSVYWGIKRKLSNSAKEPEFCDSTYFSFISLPDRRDTVLQLNVELLGDVQDYDRYFKAVVVPDRTDAPGVNYELEGIRFKIPANEIRGYVPLRLHYTNDLLEKRYRVCLKLLAGEELSTILEKKVLDKKKEQYVDLLQHTVIFDCQLQKPRKWDEKGDLGYFTALKYLEMSKYFTMNDEVWENMMAGTVMTMAVYMASKVKNAYDSDPVTLKNSPKEQDGSLMWFPINMNKKQLPADKCYVPQKK